MELALAKETEEGFLEENLFFWKEDTISGNQTVSENQIASVSENNGPSISQNTNGGEQESVGVYRPTLSSESSGNRRRNVNAPILVEENASMV